ncbi:MAG: hypothetical protein GAK39_06283 [Variovorax sp.]|nr:MAG: hypothetical protein GAK39_06283 [Variovorax sp.]
MALITFLVEDNKTIRDNLVPALEDLVNAQVVGFAETESEALAWLRAHPAEWQLLIVDLFLKEGSGLGVLAGCKERLPGQRAVVLSNYVTADIRARCETLGADAVFDKSSRVISTPSSSTATPTAPRDSRRSERRAPALLFPLPCRFERP